MMNDLNEIDLGVHIFSYVFHNMIHTFKNYVQALPH